MKLLYKSLLLGIVGAFALTSCDSYLDINENPNTPTESAASYEYRLPWALHYLQAGDEIGASVDTYFSGLLTTTAAREGGASRWVLNASTRANNIQQWFLVPCGSNLKPLYDRAEEAAVYPSKQEQSRASGINTGGETDKRILASNRREAENAFNDFIPCRE